MRGQTVRSPWFALTAHRWAGIEPAASEKLGEPWIGTIRVPLRLVAQQDEMGVTVGIRSAKPVEYGIAIAKACVNQCQRIRREVLSLPMLQRAQDFAHFNGASGSGEDIATK